MIVSLIVAADERNAIGKGGAMPWHLPDELKYFRSVTEGKPVVMGRKTWESLPPNRKPLPGRRNIVVTRQPGYEAPGADVVPGVDEAVKLASLSSDEVFIIGGGQLYGYGLEIADRLYFTRVHTEIEGADAFFPTVDFLDWREVSRVEHPADEKHAFSFTQFVFERLAPHR
jgi:dihydrofolate reductase